MPTAAEAIRQAAARFSDAGIDTARLDAEVLLRHLLGIDRTALFLRLREPIGQDTYESFVSLTEQRLTGVPVAYLTGVREFMGLNFSVGPGVLVPRPETELLVEWAGTWLKRRRQALAVDVGTGSGAIVLSLAHLLGSDDGRQLIGSDRSPVALAYAARNRSQLGMNDQVELVTGDLLTWLGRPADLILANLPYLRPDQLAANPDLRAEPELALVSGPDGLDAIARLLADAQRALSAGGAMVLELDPSQSETVAQHAAKAIGRAKVSVLPDLAGLDRFVVIDSS